MAVPPLGATGLDKSDPMTFGAGYGQLAPSSMGASEGFRNEVSQQAIDLAGPDADDETVPPGGTANGGLDETTALNMLREASSQSRSYFETYVHRHWSRNYRAYRNEHFEGSLYLRDEYKTRSKIFKPKTRSALRKQLATTAKAMFSTGDVVSVTAEDDTNQQQIQSAALKQELVSYRLGTSTLRNGIPWFLTAGGSRFDAQMTGLCCSKQFWNYKEIDTGETETIQGVDEESGMPMSFQRPKTLILIDKPDVLLIAPENVRFDPNANWTNVAQLSPYLLVQFPMTADEAFDMIQQNQRAKVPWLNVTIEQLKSYAGDTPTETIAPRTAREGGRDPQQQASGNYRNLWLTEVFMRYRGRDYVYWAIKDTKIISTPTPVEKAYPWLSGERPIVVGMGQLEPHKSYPQSAVESWQQTQAEINDAANLRLDHMKQIVSPPMKVLRGKKVDLQQVQRKGQNSLIMVNDMGDVEPMQLPDTPGSAFQEANLMNSDMDDLAGSFDSSSVSTNRDLNETVGGMHLLSEASNQVSDFDLTVWNETWCQPVVVHLVKLEEYYENDAKVLALCGQRASLWDRFGVNEITDEMLRAETTIKVNLGIGATSLPMEKLKRFSVAWDTAAKALAPFVQTGKIEVVPNAETIVEDIFSAASFRDGGKRYFQYVGMSRTPPGGGQPDPKAQAQQAQAQAKMQANQIAQEKNQGSMLIEARRLNDTRTANQQKLISDAADRRAGIDVAHMKAMAEMERNQSAQSAAAAGQAHDHVHDHMTNFMQALTQRVAPAQAAGGAKPPSVPQMAPPPSPAVQPQPGMYDNVSSGQQAYQNL